MMIDSATPIFTTEFTILAPPTMMVGGIDTGMGAPNLIHEWNPLMAVDSHGVSGIQSLVQGGGQ